MTRSQNGWSANDRSVIASYALPGGSVALRKGDVSVVLLWCAVQWHERVEPLVWPGIWGYAERNVRGSEDVSNHASGTAIDVDAPQHPLGTLPSANFSPREIAEIHSIVDFCEGVVRWGGDYTGRKDGMHLEINDGQTAESVKRIADKIRAANTSYVPAASVTPAPAPAPAGPSFDAQVRKDQADLLDTGFNPGPIDGILGDGTKDATRRFQHAARIGEDGIFGDQTRATIHKVPSWHGAPDAAGDGGYTASRWQQALVSHGWHLKVDNAWGEHSKSILAQFQADKGITADGVRGPESWTCLYATAN